MRRRTARRMFRRVVSTTWGAPRLRAAQPTLLGAAVLMAALLAGAPAVQAEPPAAPPTRILILDESNGGLETLLSVPTSATERTIAQITDDDLADAVARGSRPDLEPVSGFRKRSNDLFRTERPVEIGQQEMVLRLRLRAKRRETMSVELRF